MLNLSHLLRQVFAQMLPSQGGLPDHSIYNYSALSAIPCAPDSSGPCFSSPQHLSPLMYYIFYLFVKCIVTVCRSFESVSDSRAGIFVLFTDVSQGPKTVPGTWWTLLTIC